MADASSVTIPSDTEIDNSRAGVGGKLALLPERHPHHDLFICDVLDAIPKDDMASMEHPIFSLATKPDTRILRYEHKDVLVEIAPSVRGLATIYDKDILIYCISQLMSKKNAGQPLAQDLHLNAHELLVWTNRETSGDAYRRLKEAFERLAGTRITTNIKTNGESQTYGFGLIDSFGIVRETKSGRMSEIKVRLSDWVYRIIQGSEVLTLSRDYFRLANPLIGAFMNWRASIAVSRMNGRSLWSFCTRRRARAVICASSNLWSKIWRSLIICRTIGSPSMTTWSFFEIV